MDCDEDLQAVMMFETNKTGLDWEEALAKNATGSFHWHHRCFPFCILDGTWRCCLFRSRYLSRHCHCIVGEQQLEISILIPSPSSRIREHVQISTGRRDCNKT